MRCKSYEPAFLGINVPPTTIECGCSEVMEHQVLVVMVALYWRQNRRKAVVDANRDPRDQRGRKAMTENLEGMERPVKTGSMARMGMFLDRLYRSNRAFFVRPDLPDSPVILARKARPDRKASQEKMVQTGSLA